MNIRKQSGITLVEVLIGVTISMFIMAGVISVYGAVATSSSETLKQSRLNQEMSAMLNIMSNDIRRAGYWGGISDDLTANPYGIVDTTTQDNTTALQIRDTTTNTFIDEKATGSCIIYSYDSDNDGDDTVDTDDLYGFRWSGAGNPLEMRTAGSGTTTVASPQAVNDCADGTWVAVNNTSFLTITNLSFSTDNDGTTCTNASEPDGEDDNSNTTVDDDAEYDCLTVSLDSDQVGTIVRQVVITLEAELSDDDLVQTSMTQTVRVRNDLIITN